MKRKRVETERLSALCQLLNIPTFNQSLQYDSMALFKQCIKQVSKLVMPTDPHFLITEFVQENIQNGQHRLLPAKYPDKTESKKASTNVFRCLPDSIQLHISGFIEVFTFTVEEVDIIVELWKLVGSSIDVELITYIDT